MLKLKPCEALSYEMRYLVFLRAYARLAEKIDFGSQQKPNKLSCVTSSQNYFK